MKTVSVATFRADPMFPAVQRAVAAILLDSTDVAPVDVIVRIGWLRDADLERWRRGQVPYLERVVQANLSKLARFLRILGFHCHDLHLVPRPRSYGRLRFTKTGEAKLEAIYARHFAWPGKGPFPPERRFGPP